MRKRLRFIILAAVVLAALAMAAIFLARRPQPEAPAEEDPYAASGDEYPLLDMDMERLTGFVVASTEARLAFEPDGGGDWRIAGHEGVPVAYTAADTAAYYACHFTASEKILDEAANLGDYGLAPPLLTVTAQWDGGEKRVFVGATSPDGDYRYVMAENDPALYMVYANIAQYFDPTGDLYVDKPIRNIEIDLQEVQFLHLAIKGKPVMEMLAADMSDINILESFGTGHLMMTSPMPGRPVYMDQVNNGLILPFAELYMDRLAALEPESLAPYGLEEPRLRLAVATMDGMAELIVGGYAENGSDVYCMANGLDCVFTLPAAQVEPLLRVEPMRCAASFMAIFDIAEVSAIDVTAGGQLYHMETNNYIVPGGMENGDDAYEIAPTVNGKRVQDLAFKTLYGALIGTSYEVAAEPGAGRPANPAVTVAYTLTDGRRVTNRFYARDAQMYAAESDYGHERGAYDLLVSRLYVDETVRMIDDLVAGKLNRED